MAAQIIGISLDMPIRQVIGGMNTSRPTNQEDLIVVINT